MLSKPNQYNITWQNCLSMIKKQTSPEEFALWFEPIVPMYDGTVLQLLVPNDKHIKQIQENYTGFFIPILREQFGVATRLRYALTESKIEPKPNQQKPQIQQAKRDTNVKKLVIPSQLNPNYRFETFVEGDCNKLARSAGMAIAANPGRTAFNPLFIFGNSGLGKTHIAQAIGIEAKKQNPDLNVLYVSTSQFQAQYQNAVLAGGSNLNDFIHFYQMIDLLIIDDIQELAGKTGTQNTFFNIFNNLHLSNKQLIITSDKPAVELRDIEQRLITRFKWGLNSEIEQPDYQTKVKIINNKAEQLKIVLTDDVVAFLANNITANVREIEGALSSLAANSEYMKRTITEDLAKEVLKVYVKYVKREVTLDSIVEQVCLHTNVGKEQINSSKRTREIAQARQVAMYLCKHHTKLPLAGIGAAIGGKNHATVLHACKTITNLMETDKAFRAQVEQIERKITNV